MKKTILAILIIMVLAFSISVHADDTDGTDVPDEEEASEGELSEEDEEEVSNFINPHGVEVRLLQLEKSITRNVLAGGVIVNYLSEKDDGLDLTELNRNLDEMELLIETVQELPREGTGEELAQAYVEVKKDAINLSKQFREEIRGLVEPEDIPAIRGLIKEMDSTTLDVLNEDIKQAVRLRHAERVQKMLEKMGVENPELIEDIRNGETTRAEVKTALKEAYQGLDAKAKIRAAIAVRQNAERIGEQHKEMIERMRQHASKITERAAERAQQRSDTLERIGEYAESRGFINRSQNLEERSELWQARSDRLEALSQRLGE